MRPSLIVALAGAATLMLASPPGLGAQETTVGGVPTASNGFPFQFYGETPPNRYQQVYSASAFSSRIFIDALRFHDSRQPGAAITAGEYRIRLSTTSRAVDGLSLSLDTNLGSDVFEFFAGSLSGGTRIKGSRFAYDPTAGNLLLDVTVLSQTGEISIGAFDVVREAGDATSRVYQPVSGGSAPTSDTYGLVTTFEGSVAPEPVSMTLLGTGLLGVGALRRRRRREADPA